MPQSEPQPFIRPLVEKYDRPGPRYTSYPTAPQFQAAFAEDDYRDQAAESHRVAAPRPLSVYVHVPFCERLCYYCACHKIVTHRRERAAEYLALLKREIALQAALFDSERALAQLHLGGGTPTYLNNAQLGELMDALAAAFRFAPPEAREFSLEVDPRTVTPAQLHELRGLGFNRLSFGVQDFDPEVQAAVNRVQGEAEVAALMTAARDAGFHSVSVDLIYGLPRQTLASFAATLDKIVALRPDRIATYSYAHLPERFKAQRLIRDEDMPPPERKLELLELTIRRLTAAGYVYIGMDHFALPDDELVLAQRGGTLQRNFQGYSTHADCDLIGLGVSAIGKVGDGYSQNVKEIAAYRERLEADRLPVVRGYRLDDEDRLRRDVIHALMCHGRVDIDAIEECHGIDFATHFADALEALAPMRDDGLITLGERRLEVRPAGRLMLRNLAMAFDAYLGSGAVRYSRTV
ncbi:oxygen-independent coproporphyrinogen III oxidase [Halomonas getboli]|uniref:oxygen-independent coproporphyrinogen III oxidase n=1 Tax=Halomonas getboli TaxID=2935862 RepID=UPI001FFFA607|nr:oxygen-independent coproporphyrinogen III oxidase [Halomonas getboli]MCK2185142.1 oxygen-independent coproporphyrinogen III oxidase [Halomonas getboli]